MDRREIYSLTGSIVRIAAPDDARVVLFSVESAADTMAVLRPCNGQSRAFAAALEPGSRLRLTAGTSDGVLHGELVVDRWAPAQRMLVVDNPPLEFTQRREAFRVRASLPIEVLVTGAGDAEGARLVVGTTHDMSQGGCSFTIPGVSFHQGAEALMVLRTERRSIIVAVEVLGAHPDVRDTFRARFSRINPFDQTILAAELRRLEVSKVGTAGGLAVAR